MPNFVDWISMHQPHEPGSIPVIGSEFRISTSLETGELVREQVIGFRHEGSFDSSLHIRSDGSVVSVSGNPSSFNRLDNLFGHVSTSTAVDTYNRELEALGLPAFDSCRPHESMGSGSQIKWVPRRDSLVNREGVIIQGSFDSDDGRQASNSQSLLGDNRARFTRLDITENIATSGAIEFIRHLSSYVHHGKAGNLYPNGRTVEWGRGSRRIYQKYYDKAYDLEKKISELEKRKNSKHRDKIEAHIEYLKQCHKFCHENGIVRRETTFKATELTDRKLIHIEDWSIETMNNVIRPYQFHKKLNIEETRFDGISERLQLLGYSDRQSRQAEMIHTSWVNGGDVRSLCGSKPTYYRYREMLLSVGVDIANPCDISRLPLRVHRCEWKEIEPPSWYAVPGSEVITLRAA